MITFFASGGSVVFATGGNLSLGSQTSPVLVNSGDSITFMRVDAGTPAFVLMGYSQQGTLLNSQDTLANLTGNGTDQTVYTFTIPANTIQNGKGVRLTYFDTSNNAVAVTLKVTLGATTGLTFTTAAATNNHQITLEIMNNAGVQNAQVWTERFYDGNTISSSGAVTSAENFATALALKVTANEAGPNTITPKKWILEIIK